MTTNKVYESIVDHAPAELDKVVLGILSGHVGHAHRITRRALMLKINLEHFGGKAAMISLDRQVRRAIFDLQNRGVPVISNSGGGGYWLAASKSEIDETCSELESRIARLQEKVKALRFGTQLQSQAGQTDFLGLL